MGKKVMRLTESDLHKIINESVNRILNEQELIAENKLTDLIKQYGAQAVLAAAIAGGIGTAAYNKFANNGENRPTWHLYGQNMPDNHKAMFGDYANGQKAVAFNKIGQPTPTNNPQNYAGQKRGTQIMGKNTNQ